MRLETRWVCRSRIDVCPEKYLISFWNQTRQDPPPPVGENIRGEEREGEIHLIPLDTVDVVAVHVEAAVEDGRLAGLLKG